MSKGVVALIAARMSSTRLLGKPLKKLGSSTPLDWVLARTRQAREIDRIVVATTTSSSDNCLIEACGQLGVPCFRGSEHDVLGRFVAAAEHFDAKWVIRINTDNPMIDPAYLDRIIEYAVHGESEYVSYCHEGGRPVMLSTIGFFAEVVSRSCLAKADRLILDPAEREHVTLGIYRRPQVFRVEFIPLPRIFDSPYLRFTLDTRTDLETLTAVVEELGEGALYAQAADIVHVVEQSSRLQETMLAQNNAHPK